MYAPRGAPILRQCSAASGNVTTTTTTYLPHSSLRSFSFTSIRRLSRGGGSGSDGCSEAATRNRTPWLNHRTRSSSSSSSSGVLPRISDVPVRTFIRDAKSISPASRRAPKFAFAFDIDGVLLHVAKPIPGATETLKYLQQHDIPFILLTNGGGKHERERVEELSARLGVPLSTDNFVQSHTPFQELVNTTWSSHYDQLDRHIQKELLEDDASGGNNNKHNSNNKVNNNSSSDKNAGFADKNILITGSDPAKSRLIAEAYGFRSVITPADIVMAHPTMFPFESHLQSYYAATARPLPSPSPKIDAIFVFNDPRDWAVDTQIITDLLLSEKGVLGTYSPKNGRKKGGSESGGRGRGRGVGDDGDGEESYGWQSDGQPHLYFSNHDLFWSATYHLPRFGQGAFQAALAGIWRQITGGKAEMKRTTIGKPYARTYEFAETVLAHWRAALLEKKNHANNNNNNNNSNGGVGREGGAGGGKGDGEDTEPLARVYMVGDNPESDIRGANEYRSPHGTEWESILVRTGVWSKERDGEPKYAPTAVADDAKAAVEWALEREGWR